jgi:hypothetical protein
MPFKALAMSSRDMALSFMALATPFRVWQDIPNNTCGDFNPLQKAVSLNLLQINS